jgi:hypothetical protein
MLPCDDADVWTDRFKELQAERRDHFRTDDDHDPEDDVDEDLSLYVWPYLHRGEP